MASGAAHRPSLLRFACLCVSRHKSRQQAKQNGEGPCTVAGLEIIIFIYNSNRILIVLSRAVKPSVKTAG